MQQLLGDIGVTRLRLVLLVDVASEVLVVAVGSRVTQLKLVKPLRHLLSHVKHVILEVFTLLFERLLTERRLVTVPFQRRLVSLEPFLMPLLINLSLVRVRIIQLNRSAVNLRLLALGALTQLCVDAVQAVGHLIVLAITVVN